MQIVALHAIEAAEHEEPLVVEDDGLVEGAGGQRDVQRDAPSPRLQLEVVLVDVIKSLERQVNTTEDVHGILRCTGRVSVSTLDIALHLAWLQPNTRVQIKDGKVIECHLAVPAPEYIHVVLINHRRVPKPDLGLRQEAEMIGYLQLAKNGEVLFIIQIDFLALDVAPTVSADLITVHVGEDVRFIAPTIYVELVKEAYEAMVGTRLRCVLRVQVNPLLLNRLKLCQVVKVDATLSRVPTEEENTILEGEAVGSGARCRLLIHSLGVQSTYLLPIVGD